ncbi:metallophosphoesterase family protein [Alteromonas sp. BZK5]|uniref:metallophosphoesterase family protein n=2 Tax=unclassified Alteromonas TaxID=2614992 RepID=UPI001653CA05|nr:metallophosphoesterase [Alteromonas sp. BZK5]MBC6986177.1 metallophosphoesterase [Alteromonas sp. BZK5]MEC7689349.1 metallophosphoesterase [Pseudomonadota bacterium]
MKLAVISDLHVGDYARAKDFNPSEGEHSVIDCFMDSFKSKFGKCDYKCDYLFVAGDITNRANKTEFDLATVRILEIAETLTVPESNIFIVPGNHDSNWSLGAADAENGVTNKQDIRDSRYKYFNSNELIKNMLSRAKFGSFHESPYFVFWETEDIAILAFNSSANDNDEVAIHHGEVTSQLVQSVRVELDQVVDLHEKKLKVVLFHHHPLNYEEKTYVQTDHSIMSNAEALLDLASEYCFDFVIHGHKHIPRYNHFVKNGLHPLNILCSGSFVARLDDRWFDDVGNSFHIIEINQHCLTHRIPQGRIWSWSHFVQHGWIENNQARDSIPFESKFGSGYSRTVLETKLEKLIKQEFTKSSYVKWSDLEERDSELSFCSSQILTLILQRLKSKIGFSIYSDPEIILLKD